MRVYLVIAEDYEDHFVHSAYLDKEKAMKRMMEIEKAQNFYPNGRRRSYMQKLSYYIYSIDEVEVEE